MKAFKIADCVGQVLLIGLGAFVILMMGIDESFGLYLVVGGWQLLSMFIHLVAGKYYVSDIRKGYHGLLLLTVVAGIICAIIGGEALLAYMIGMLIWSPVLAIVYLIASIKETKRLMVQPVNAEIKQGQS
jgi:hypothetical protein